MASENKYRTNWSRRYIKELAEACYGLNNNYWYDSRYCIYY